MGWAEENQHLSKHSPGEDESLRRLLHGVTASVMRWIFERWSGELTRELEKFGRAPEVNLDSLEASILGVSDEFIELAPPRVMHYPESVGITRAVSHAWSPQGVYQIRNPTVDLYSGLIFLGSRVVTESGLGYRDARDASFITGATARIAAQRSVWYSETISPLGRVDDIYHFLYESLPRILRVMSVEKEVRFIGNGSMHAFPLEILDVLGIPYDFFNDADTVASAPKGLLSPPQALWFPYPDDAKLAGISIRAGFGIPESQADKRIYVSRRFSRRSIPGEIQLEEALRARDFQILFLEDLPVVSQIEAFARATVVVAPHGAGLSHLMHMHPGGTVVEIINSSYWFPCYQRLAQNLNLRYIPCLLMQQHGPEFGEILSHVDSVLESSRN